MLSRSGILAATRRRIVGDPLGALCLSFRDRCLDFFCRLRIGFPGLEKQLEQHRALELLERIRHLVPGSARGFPLRDDRAGVRHTNPEVGVSYLPFPDDFM